MGEPAPKTGASKENKEAAKPAGILPGIDIDANVQIGKLVTEKFTFNDAKGDLSVADGIVHLKQMSVQAFQGSIESKGMIDLRNPAKRPFDLDLNIQGVQSNDLLPKFTSFGQYLFGKFSTTTKIKGDLNDTLGLDTGTLLGSGNVQIAEGKLAGLPLTSKLADATGVSELREVNFKSWTNAFAIENGRIQVKDLKVNAGSTDFAMGGSQGLDGSLDYALVVKLPSSFSDRINLGGTAGQLLELFKDKDGRYNFTFDVGGTSTSPVVRLNAKAQEAAAKNKLEEDLKKKAQEGLMKLFKKP
jgi:AsmA protein